MKKLYFIPLAFTLLINFAQEKPKKAKVIHNKNKVKELPDSGLLAEITTIEDQVDKKMKGPNGEKVYVGSNGTRYYFKGGKKIYLVIKKKPI